MGAPGAIGRNALRGASQYAACSTPRNRVTRNHDERDVPGDVCFPEGHQGTGRCLDRSAPRRARKERARPPGRRRPGALETGVGEGGWATRTFRRARCAVGDVPGDLLPVRARDGMGIAEGAFEGRPRREVAAARRDRRRDASRARAREPGGRDSEGSEATFA